MLTLEEIAEGRRLHSADIINANPCASDVWETWLRVHAGALLEAAERVARQEAYAAEPNGYDTPAALPPPTEQEIRLVRIAGQMAEAERERARAALELLRPDLEREFVMHQHTTNPQAFQPKHVLAWLHARGLLATVVIDPRQPGNLLIDPLRVLR